MELFISRAIILAIALFVGLPILYAGLGFLWNKKLRPRQIMRGKPTARLQNITKRFWKFSFSEDPASLFNKSTNPTLKKITKLRTLYIMAALLGIVGYIITGSLYFWIPAATAFLIAAGRANRAFNQRYSILAKMFAVANSNFRYGKNAEFDPWSYVNIQEWTDITAPGKTVITFPPSFRTDMMGSRDSFEQHFTSTVTNDNIWVYEWDGPKGQVVASPVKHLPELVQYPGTENVPWNIFPVGEGANGMLYYDVMKTPHVLLGGSTGAGKSVIQRNMIFHCIQHNDRWRFLGVDLKRVELSSFNNYKRTVIGIGTDKEQGLGVVKYAKDEMDRRYKMMEEQGVNNFINLPDPPYSILLMIDEAFMFLEVNTGKTDAEKEEAQMSGEASHLIGQLLRLGRASGIFVVMATQRPDATVIKGEMKNNMDVRIAAGRMDSTPSSMILDSGDATRLPGHIKGRGVIRFTGAAEQFQGYFAEADWIDNWLLSHPDVEPSTVEEGGHLHEAFIQYQTQLQMQNQENEEPKKNAKSTAKQNNKSVTLKKQDAPKAASNSEKISWKDRLSFAAPVANTEEDNTVTLDKIEDSAGVQEQKISWKERMNSLKNSALQEPVDEPQTKAAGDLISAPAVEQTVTKNYEPSQTDSMFDFEDSPDTYVVDESLDYANLTAPETVVPDFTKQTASLPPKPSAAPSATTIPNTPALPPEPESNLEPWEEDDEEDGWGDLGLSLPAPEPTQARLIPLRKPPAPSSLPVTEQSKSSLPSRPIRPQPGVQPSQPPSPFQSKGSPFNPK